MKNISDAEKITGLNRATLQLAVPPLVRVAHRPTGGPVLAPLA